MPDSALIQQLAATTYDEMKKSEREGVESLLETEEGKLDDIPTRRAPIPSSKIVHRLAEEAAKFQDFERVTDKKNKNSDEDNFMTEYMLALDRECIKQTEKDGFCELYDDGSRCLKTDDSHAFCGFVKKASESDSNSGVQRHFAVVPIERLK